MHRYVSIDHYQAPYTGAVLQGLGTTRQYYEMSQFRSPYRHGYFQDNTLFGLGIDATPSPIVLLQRALGVRESGTLDNPTQAAIRNAQAQNKLPVTGVVDAPLLVALGLLDPNRLPPAGATWHRDLSTALSQVPPIGYGLLSAALFFAAYVTYGRWKKQKPSESKENV